MPEGTLAEALSWNIAAPAGDNLGAAAGAIGLLDDALLPGGLEARLDRGGANLSGGQRLRIAVARGTQRNIEGWVARKRPDSKSAKAAAAAQAAAAGAEQPDSQDEQGMDKTAP